MTDRDLDRDQQQRLENLRADLEELREGADPSLPPPRIADDVLRRLVRADSAYATLPRPFLAACGFELRPPDDVPDGELHAELWRLLWVMALLRLLLEHTDHLDDRALYTRLYETELMEPANFQPGDEHASIYVIDLLGGHSREDLQALVAYYGDRLDDDHLAELRTDLGDDAPEPRERPADRDRLLP